MAIVAGVHGVFISYVDVVATVFVATGGGIQFFQGLDFYAVHLDGFVFTGTKPQ